MYSQKMLHNLKTIGETLQKLEGQKSETYLLFQEIMEEVTENLKSFGISTWCYADIEQLLEDEGITLEQSEIVEIAEAADERLREGSTEVGWDTLYYFIDEHVNNKGKK